jgi:hypothetical protein
MDWGDQPQMAHKARNDFHMNGMLSEAESFLNAHPGSAAPSISDLIAEIVVSHGFPLRLKMPGKCTHWKKPDFPRISHEIGWD